VNVAANIVIALLVLALILVRQLRKRTVREASPYRIMAILAIIGLVETVQFQKDHTIGGAAWGILVASLAVGAGFGALRGMTVHVWREDGVLYRQGNAMTVVLWIVGLGLHIAADVLIGHADASAKGLGDTAILLYLAVTLGAQQFYVLERAQHLA
jgi:hypothetical protein